MSELAQIRNSGMRGVEMAGRKKRPGPREPNGRLSRVRPDRGASRIRAERRFLAGERGDQTIVGTPLGVLLANGIIREELCRAGTEYARLHAVAIGLAPVSAVDWTGGGHGHDNSDGEERWRCRAHDRWREAAALLGRVSRRRREIVDNVCVYERTPRWLRPRHPRKVRSSDVRDADELLAGLMDLAAMLGYLPRRAA